MAACTGAYATTRTAAIADTASQVDCLRRRILVNYRPAFGRASWHASLAAKQAKACSEPLRNAYLDRIGVDPALAGDEHFDRSVAAVETHAAFDFVAGLIASIMTAVDAKVANIRRCQQTNTGVHLHVAAQRGIELPLVVDGRLHEDAANVGTGIECGL